jgi:hypothetical protein
MNASYITGTIEGAGILIPRISAQIRLKDFLGAVMVRWGFYRGRYRVSPGLYAIGTPKPESDVFVTANYKLTFDNLRKKLQNTNGWILVLDTKGVNVWCAAGKGTFSTAELVSKINSASLEKVVNHRRLILPQLSATGVAAHKIKEVTGFNVHFGPARASDIKKFISSGYRADRNMRKVKFGLWDRIKLIPNDFIYGKYYLLGAMAVLFLLSGLSINGISFINFSQTGGPAMLNTFLAYCAGIVLTPLFLPYLPGRYFSLKGFFSGMIVFVALWFTSLSHENFVILLSWLFITGAIASFTSMNFTGSSTYTSLSGVKKEMKIFIPLQISSAVLGLILQVTGKLIK